MKGVAVIVGVSMVGLGLCAALLGGWFLVAAGATGGTGCATGAVSSHVVPAELVPLFARAASTYELGADGPAVLAGLTKVESDFGRNMGPSGTGAVGWTQFMPSTWRRFGVDGDGDGTADPMNAADAIMSAAGYLRYLGAPRDWRRALFGYNHAGWYVEQVLTQARALAGPAGADGATLPVADCGVPFGGAGARVFGGGRIVPIPGQGGELIDERLVRDVEVLQQRFHISVTAGFAPTGHATDGEHPLGLAIDVVPASGGSWDDIDALARWAEPLQNHPRPPFRWVGYDGDAGHGRGDHLHLSWEHAPCPDGRPPATWVRVLMGAA